MTTPQETRMHAATRTVIDTARALLAYQFREPPTTPGAMDIAIAVKDCASLLDMPDDVRRIVENVATRALQKELDK